MSKRARQAALKREGERLFAGVNLRTATPQPTERECLLRQAEQLRELAERGMNVRVYQKRAADLERQAEETEP